MENPSFLEFLTNLMTSPGFIGLAVGAILSFVVDYIPGYETLAAKMKRLVFLGLCLVLPLGAAAVGGLAGYWSFAFESTFWPALVAGFTAFGSGTFVHTRELKETCPHCGREL
jgi:hypothetical protein